MCQIHLRRSVGLSLVCFGGGILLSFLLPWCALAWLEAVLVTLFGLLLIRGRA